MVIQVMGSAQAAIRKPHQLRAEVSSRSGAALHFRYIAGRSAGSAERLAWIERLGMRYHLLDLASNPDILTSRAEPDFDFVVFGGEDSSRLARFIREHGLMLHDKPKLCVCLRSQPEQRARLLMAGFDDVADVRRVGLEEFLLRAQALVRRYHAARAKRQQAQTRIARLEQVCDISVLTARQRAVVWNLLEAPGRLATCYALRLAACRGGDEISPESLKTMISAIRKALRSGYQIVAQAPALYRLVQYRPA